LIKEDIAPVKHITCWCYDFLNDIFTVRNTCKTEDTIRVCFTCKESVSGVRSNKYDLQIFIEESMVMIATDDTQITLYNPSDDLTELIRDLARSEGLFVWKPCQCDKA
jgi:hypothetical protein